MRSGWLILLPALAVGGLALFGAADRHAGGVARARTNLPPSVEPLPHYAPAENLEALDLRVLDDAAQSIDMAAFELTDRAIMTALSDAAARGVAVRLLLDRSQLRERGETGPAAAALRTLETTPGIAVRTKGGGAYMHLKAYAVDGRLLRMGSANFSASGLARQDNDLVLLGRAAAVRFEADFASMWAAGEAP